LKVSCPRSPLSGTPLKLVVLFRFIPTPLYWSHSPVPLFKLIDCP
jgi:hypothetical protein